MWKNIDSCWYYIDTLNAEKPFVLFDYDDTLSNRFTSIPRENVIDVLQKLSLDNNICIFTNQKGISSGRTSHEKVQNLITDFKKTISVPISVFYSTEDDLYRKPMTGMYELLLNLCKVKKTLYYCGDAAGRKGDFSVSDLYFANNCGLIFKTPEEIFTTTKLPVILDNKNLTSLALYSGDNWKNGVLTNNRNIFNSLFINNIIDKFCDNLVIENEKKNLFIMVGAQGCGKSTLSKALSEKYKLGIVSGDIQKTKANMKKHFKKFSTSDEYNGIIIDNTNSTKEKREEWIKMIDGNKWNIKIIFIDIDKNIAIHLTKYRILKGGAKIPTIAIHTFYKYLEKPDVNDSNVIILNKPILMENNFNYNLRFC